MRWKKLTRKSMPAVFARILQMPAQDQAWIAKAFDEVLDELRDEDAFGTEGQRDPRGDPRS